MIFRLTREGEFVHVSSAAERITGYTPEQLHGMSLSGLVKPEIRTQVLRFYERQCTEKTPVTYHEFPVITKEGKEIWIGQNVSVEETDEGTWLNGIARDITDRVRHEKQNQTWAARLQVLLENLQEGVLVEDENRIITIVNRSFCDLFSVTLIPEDIMGRHYLNAANHIKKLFRNHKEFTEQEDALVAARNIHIGQILELFDGRIFERDFIPIYVETKYMGNLWKYRDSTEKHKTKNDLIKSQKKYKSVIDTMRLGLLEVDKNDRIMSANDSFCEILAYKSVSELIGKPAFETLLDEEQQQIMREQMTKREAGLSNAYEIKVKKADGGFAWMLISGAPLYDEKDNIIGSVGVHLDITYQKQLTIEMEEKKALKNLAEWQEKAMEHLEEKVMERTSEVVKQKQIIEHKNKEITNSINYALQIQEALLPNKEDIYESLKDCFVLYKPKDIVSGDFYYFRKTNDGICYIAAADSTGHGVPGAFMSMLGSEKLKDAAEKATYPGDILSKLNLSLKQSLHYGESEDRSIRDGYDIALCSIDLNTKMVYYAGAQRPIWNVHYAGAHRPVWIIRKDSNTIDEIRATKAAIGGWTESNQVFETQQIQLQKGDTFYIFTDGYPDQFGMQGRRFMSKRFKDLLLSIQNKSMREQEAFLDEFLGTWMGEYEQTDDILVIGIRI
jgi:PAS domain S-box-containing protein